MKILYLCSKSTFDSKMSRVRFDGMAAIAKKSDVIYSGNGWDNYVESLTVQENMDRIYKDSRPDIVVAYKPDNFKGFSEISVPKCIRYNEMWPVKEWTEELSRNKIDLCIAHHLNDIPKYDHVKNVVFSHVPHSAQEAVYKDYGLEKAYDILFTGALGGHYPFRSRLLDIIKKDLMGKIRCKIIPHPGNKGFKGCTGVEYAREINKSKMVVTCSSKHFYRLGKYVEIPMSGSILCGDLPDQDQDEFSKIMVALDRDWSDEKIAKVIIEAVNDEGKMNSLKLAGLEWSKEYTQKRYADRFISEVQKYLELRGGE